MWGAAWSAVAHSPFAGGLSQLTDLGAICWICWAVIWVFGSAAGAGIGAGIGAAEARRGRRGRRVVGRIVVFGFGDL